MDSRTINLRGFAGSAGKNIMQGIGGFVFGNENNVSSEDSHVERYLDRISNGVIAEDRRAAMTELQSLVGESRQAQMAFGAMGFPVLLNILREEREDVELIRGALETLISSLTPLETSNGSKNEIQAASINSDLLSRESENISLLLGLLSEDDFYVRYYTLQLLTVLLTNSPKRLQEAILSIPRGITSLMDMLMDREVIRNEALLLLTYLTREAEEIQKIVVFEGAFEKIFSIITEEGGSDGGVVVQDCLELLKNLIRNNASNQILLRETIGYDPLVSILKLRRGSAYNFTQQKTLNLLNALETVELLLIGEPAKDNNNKDNQTAFAQKNILSPLLLLGVESQWAPVSVRCMALRCIGDLVKGHPNNLKQLASKQVGEEPHLIPALNAIFSISLRTQLIQEFLSADFVIKCFCEKNPEGQTLLTSTISDSNSLYLNPIEAANLPFGSMLLQALVAFASNGDSETCCRAASALSHILKDNLQCKEKVLKIELESPIPSLSLTKEPLLHQIVKYLALIFSKLIKEKSQNQTIETQNSSYLLPLLLKLLIIWLQNCPNAVSCILSQPTYLTYFFELISNQNLNIYTTGLTALLLGECVIYNKNTENNKDSFAILDSISQKLGLTSYFSKFDELAKIFKSSLFATSAQTSKPLSRTNTASMIEAQDTENEEENKNNIRGENESPIFLEVFDASFIGFVSQLEKDIREGILDIFGNTKSKVFVLPAELEQKNGEKDGDYVKRLRAFLEKQCNEMQDLLARNATLAEELVRTGNTGAIPDSSTKPSTIKDRVQSETLKKDLESSKLIETLISENSNLTSEASNFKSLAIKLESDLKSLSDAYNSLEQANVQLEREISDLRNPNLERIREEAREEAQRESEGELNDLLVCLGQEQSRVERLSARLAELGEDTEKLLEGIGEDSGLLDEDDE